MCGAAVLGMFVVPEAALAANPDVVVWGQADPRWASIPLGAGGYTLGQAGCAVTACSMAASYFGSSKDPGEICRWLNSNGGFLAGTGFLYWGKIPAAAGGTISYAGSVTVPYGSPANMTDINNELDAGNLVVAEVRLSGQTHYILMTGHDGSTYYINDSGYHPTTGDKTTFNSRYGAPVGDYIWSYHKYRGTHSAPIAHYNPIAPGDPGFAKHGTALGWQPIDGGFRGTGTYTWNGGGTRDNYARWTFDLSKINGPRKYKVQAFITSTHAGTTAADYHINTTSGLVHKSVNQAVVSNNWANLGSYSFASGATWIELDDVTTEAAGTKEIAFDAIWLIPYFNLKYSAGTGGTISGTATQSILKGADGTKVTAVPNAGYRFVKWSDGKTTAARTDLDVAADKTVSASFAAVVVPSVHRFYNTRLGVHFYTADEAEKTNTINNLGGTYTYEGVAYGVNPLSNTQPLHRFYNKRVGVHFYTASETEKANTINNLGDTYTYEGVAYNVSAANATGRTAVHRFYNTRTGTHFYTSDGAEKQNIQNTLGSIYTYEGVGFYLAP